MQFLPNRNVSERILYAFPLHYVLAGEVPNYGVAIKGDDVFSQGVRVGTIMRVSQVGMSAAVTYLHHAANDPKSRQERG